MTDITVTTPRGGDVRLRPAPKEVVDRVRESLPLGLELLPSNPGTVAYGIVMRRGSREAYAIKQQQVERPSKNAAIVSQVHSILITLSLAQFSKLEHQGLIMPCPYCRTKQPDSIETGIAYFGGMPPAKLENANPPSECAFDHTMGHGFTDDVCCFLAELKQNSKKHNLTVPACIGLDLRPRSLLGILVFGFLVVDGQIVTLKTKVTPKDPTWALLRSTGVDEVWHMPSLPFAIDEKTSRTR